MYSYQVVRFDEPARLNQVDIPSIRSNTVMIEIKACALNFADLLMATGKYQDTPTPPFTMGLELAGKVTELGAGVDPELLGKRVAAFSGHGGLAEFAVIPAERCVPLPDNMSFNDAAAFQIAYGTSHVALDHKARLQPGETLLVLGASGGVGLTAVEIGKLMGARVIACARGAEKLDVARMAGADHLIDSETQNIRDEVLALGGADVVYDPIGGDQFTAAFRACNPDARILVIGFASGTLPEIKPNHLLVKNISLLGLYWGGYMKFAPHVVTDSMKQLFKWYENGDLRPHISHTFPLEQTAEALETLRTRKSTGKIVVEIGQRG